MNNGFFTGRVARAIELRTGSGKPVCYMTLIQNAFAGTDDAGNAVEREVSMSFTVFGNLAVALSQHGMVGDQIFVQYHLANNNREVDGEMRYQVSLIVDKFEFGSSGKRKREAFAQRDPATA